MYLWKAWHDSRSRVLMYLMAAMALGFLWGVMAWSDAQFVLRWAQLAPRFFSMKHALAFITREIGEMQPRLIIASVWSALALACSSLGEYRGQRTIEFLLSRPQQRWRMVATDWLLHLSAILLALTLLVLGMVPGGVLLGGRDAVISLLTLLPTPMAVAAAAYGICYVLTILTGSGMRGLNYTIAVLLLVTLVPPALKELWHVEMLAKAQDWLAAVADWRMDVVRNSTKRGIEIFPAQFPLAQWLVFVSVGLAALVFSVIYLERKEV